MNSLPTAFYETMALDSMQSTLTNGSKLRGRIGAVCAEFLERKAFQDIHVSNDSSRTNLRSMHRLEKDKRAKNKETSKKHLLTAIYLAENNAGTRSDPAIAHLPVIDKCRNVFLRVCTSNLSKQVVEFSGLIPLVSYLIIATPLTETIERIMEKMVAKKTLNFLFIQKEHQFNAVTTKTLLDLLKQDQFSHAYLCENCELPLERIIVEWRENAEKMAGKTIHCQSIVVEDPVGDFGFQKCSEEEVAYLYRYHCQPQKSRAENAFILRSHNGRALFVLADERMFNKNGLIFT